MTRLSTIALTCCDDSTMRDLARIPGVTTPKIHAKGEVAPESLQVAVREPFLWMLLALRQVSLVFEHLSDQFIGVVERVFRRSSAPISASCTACPRDIAHQAAIPRRRGNSQTGAAARLS